MKKQPLTPPKKMTSKVVYVVFDVNKNKNKKVIIFNMKK
jgi:hypothetical protein